MENSFKVIIAGSRTFSSLDKLTQICDHLLQNRENIEIVSGHAKGADQLGEQFAHLKCYSLKIFPAQWNKYGKSAGFKKNAEMSEYADALIAFWDEKSKGTRHMIDLAKSMGLNVKVHLFRD